MTDGKEEKSEERGGEQSRDDGWRGREESGRRRKTEQRGWEKRAVITD